MSLYALPLKDPAAAPLAPASFLAETGAYTPESAAGFLRTNPGFIARRAEFGSAQKLAKDAAAAGFETLLVAETSLPALPPPITAEKVETAKGGFSVLSSGASFFIPFGSVTLVHPCVYAEETAPDNTGALKKELDVKMAEMAGRPAPERTAAKETFFRADLLTSEGLRLLLRPELLDFSPLGAELSPSSLDNFRLLLSRLSAPCFNALKSPLLAALLDARPLAPFRAAGDGACDAGLARMMLLLPREGRE